MIIKLADEICKISNLHLDYLSDRRKAKELYEKGIECLLFSSDNPVRKIVFDCQGIMSASSSFIDELLFINMFRANYQHGNSVLLLTNLEEEFYFDVRSAVEGKKKLIEEAKKSKRYFLTIDQMHAQFPDGFLEKGSISPYQVGSPYLLCEYQKVVEVVGFSEGEKQKLLLEDIVRKGIRFTSSMLAKRENISCTAANNRLNRLHEKCLIFRGYTDMDSSEKFEYFYI